MKLSAQNTKSVPRTIRKSGTLRGTASADKRRMGIASSVRRYGKRTLRDMLLSKTMHAGFKVMFGLLIGGSALYGAYAVIQRTVADEVIVTESEILSRVRKHVALPEGKPDTVVRVQEPDTLRGQNTLFEGVEEGNYIIMYPTVAVVYDLRNDKIVAMRVVGR